MHTNRVLKKILCVALIISSFLHAQDGTFFEKIDQIRPNLYKISAEELSLFLGHSFGAPPTITADDLHTLMQSDKESIVVNVLPSSLHDDCHIAGSINIPLKELTEKVSAWDRNKKIIVYCALYECDAGEKAYILLNCLGFTNVIDYTGGIKEWFQLGYPTEGPATYTFLHTKGAMMPEEEYPDIMVCSRQKKWIHRYQ